MTKLSEATKDDPPDLSQVHVGSESGDSIEKDSLDHFNEDRPASFSIDGLYMVTWSLYFLLHILGS